MPNHFIWYDKYRFLLSSILIPFTISLCIRYAIVTLNHIVYVTVMDYQVSIKQWVITDFLCKIHRMKYYSQITYISAIIKYNASTGGQNEIPFCYNKAVRTIVLKQRCFQASIFDSGCDSNEHFDMMRNWLFWNNCKRLHYKRLASLILKHI